MIYGKYCERGSEMTLSYPKEKMKVLLLEGIHPSAKEWFAQHGYSSVEILPGALEPAALAEAIADVHMIGIRSRTQLDREALSHAKRLMSIACFCIGTNQVDKDYAASIGVPVFNAPHSNTRSVAELVIGLVVMLGRGIFEKSQAAHAGRWLKKAKGAHEIRGKTIGIVGYGHIGSQVSVMAESMGMQVLFYDIEAKLPLGNAQACASLEELLESSDVVTLHVPETPQTMNMIGAKEFQLMKDDAVFINYSRGTVVDIDALAEVIKGEHLAGAAIDVFPVEPKDASQVFQSPLQGLDRVILTPHIGGSTEEAQESIAREVSYKLIYFSDRGSTEGATNFPRLSLSPHEGTHRILHIHHNVPGVLQALNQRIAEKNINVVGQYLQTEGDIGYVVCDISKDASDQLLDSLKEVKGTIRTRVLY